MPKPIASPDPDLAALAARLGLMADQRGSLVLHVTSPRAGPGSSGVSRDLAQALSRDAWRRVCLVHAQAGAMDPAPTASAAMREICWAGGELPAPQALGATLDGLRQDRMLAIIDGAPVLDTPGRARLGALADAVLLVIEAERTELSDARAARIALDALGATVLGVVFSGVRQRLPRRLDRMLR